MTNRATTRPRPAVKSSSQDPVQRWLDIFVPMTGLPRASQSDIRAELEDHLRARASDLMITGLSEPEAVQHAVNELGETAQLAKQFRTALKARRTSPMNIALVAAAGIAVTAGIFSFTGVDPARVIDHAHAHAAAVHGHSADHDGVVHEGRPADRSHPIANLRGETYGGLFSSLAELSEIPILVHWDRLAEIGIDSDSQLGLEVDALPSHVLYRLLQERTESEGDPLTLEESPELIEVSIRSHFDRRSIEIRPHDIGNLIDHQASRQSAESAGQDVLSAVVQLVEPESWDAMGGDLASAQVIGASLIVNAPERLHDEIASVIEMMRGEVERYAREQENYARRAQEARELATDKARRERETIIERMIEEMQGYLDRIVALELQKSKLESEYQHLRSGGNAITRAGETQEQAAQRAEIMQDEFRAKEPMIRAELARVEVELVDTHAFRDAARDQLINLRRK